VPAIWNRDFSELSLVSTKQMTLSIIVSIAASTNELKRFCQLDRPSRWEQLHLCKGRGCTNSLHCHHLLQRRPVLSKSAQSATSAKVVNVRITLYSAASATLDEVPKSGSPFNNKASGYETTIVE